MGKVGKLQTKLMKMFIKPSYAYNDAVKKYLNILAAGNWVLYIWMLGIILISGVLTQVSSSHAHFGIYLSATIISLVQGLHIFPWELKSNKAILRTFINYFNCLIFITDSHYNSLMATLTWKLVPGNSVGLLRTFILMPGDQDRLNVSLADKP